MVICGLKLAAGLRNDGGIWGARFISVCCQVASKNKSNDGPKVVICGLKLAASLCNWAKMWGARFISVLLSGFLRGTGCEFAYLGEDLGRAIHFGCIFRFSSRIRVIMAPKGSFATETWLQVCVMMRRYGARDPFRVPPSVFSEETRKNTEKRDMQI